MTALFILLILTLMACFIINITAYYFPLSLFDSWRDECHEFLQQEPDQKQSQQKTKTTWSIRILCHQCKQKLSLSCSIPVFNFFTLLLKKQCHHCSSAISRLFAISNIVTLFASFIVWHYFGFSLTGICLLVITWLLILDALIDLQHHILPDQITLLILWLGLIINTSTGLFCTISSAIFGAAAGYLLLFIIHHAYKFLCKKEGMGYGDFKMLAALGAWLGLSYIPFILFFAAFIASIIMGVSIIFKKSNSQQAFAFGPYIALSGWIMLIWGSTITQAYLQFVTH